MDFIYLPVDGFYPSTSRFCLFDSNSCPHPGVSYDVVMMDIWFGHCDADKGFPRSLLPAETYIYSWRPVLSFIFVSKPFQQSS